jgi:hypothetical protein
VIHIYKRKTKRRPTTLCCEFLHLKFLNLSNSLLKLELKICDSEMRFFLIILCYILFLRHSCEKNRILKSKCKKINTKQRKKGEKSEKRREKKVCISRNIIHLCTYVVVFHSNLFPCCSYILVTSFISSSNFANTFFRPAARTSTLNTYSTLLSVTHLHVLLLYNFLTVSCSES